MALVAVLIVVSILSIIAVSVNFTQSVSYRLSQNSISRAKAEALAEAGVSRAILALRDSRADQRWRADGRAYEFSFAGTRMNIRIQDEAGRIDLNTANEDILGRLFRSAGFDDQGADEMVDRLVDWRDRDDLHRLNGAEAPAYAAAGLAYGPRNGRFQTVDEVRMVIGMTAASFARIAPAVTVYTNQPGIDRATAPLEALGALPGMDREKADAIVAARAPALAMVQTPRSGRAFTIRVEIATADSEFVREAVVRFVENARLPYWVLKWDRGPAVLE